MLRWEGRGISGNYAADLFSEYIWNTKMKLYRKLVNVIESQYIIKLMDSILHLEKDPKYSTGTCNKKLAEE